MFNKDKSYETKFKILRGQNMSIFHLQNPSKKIEGPIGTASSTLTDIKYYRGPTCIPGNLVVNGDFADGVVNTLYTIPPGWDLVDGDGNNQISDGIVPPPPVGTRAFRAGNLYNKSYLRQAIPTVLGVTYTLSYYLFDAGNLTGGPWNASANLIYFSASVSADNTPIGNVISYTYPAVDTGFGWTQFTSRFTATSNSTLLTFTSSQPPQYFYLTGISVSC